MASYVTHKILHILLNECTYMIIHVHYIHDIHLYTVYNNIHYKDIIHHWIWKIPTFHVQALEVALSVWVAWKVKLPSWQIASSRCRSGSNRSCARPINCPRCHLLELKAHKQIEKNLGEWWMVNGGAFVPLNVVCQFSALKRNKRKLFQFTQTPNTMLSRWCVCIDSLRFCIYFVVRPRCGLSTMESSVQGSKTERWNEVTKHLKHWKICTFFFQNIWVNGFEFLFSRPVLMVCWKILVLWRDFMVSDVWTLWYSSWVAWWVEWKAATSWSRQCPTSWDATVMPRWSSLAMATTRCTVTIGPKNSMWKVPAVFWEHALEKSLSICFLELFGTQSVIIMSWGHELKLPWWTLNILNVPLAFAWLCVFSILATAILVFFEFWVFQVQDFWLRGGAESIRTIWPHNLWSMGSWESGGGFLIAFGLTASSHFFAMRICSVIGCNWTLAHCFDVGIICEFHC